MAEEQPGRKALGQWIASRPTNYYSATPNLRASLSIWSSEGLARSLDAKLAEFGKVVAELIDPSVATLERHRGLPALLPYDSIGSRIDAIEFHPAYRDIGTAVWRSGLLAADGSSGSAFEQAALFYLLSLVGEGGHACPAVCTAGLARAIRHRGAPAMQERFLGGLTEVDYDRCLRGSQFLTEVQGGSDVGANAAVAVRDAVIAGAWRISGEKWFCSVADADLFAVTARPEGAPSGTRGLGCFVVPRLLDDGSPNGFRIRRLKDKLGTRCMASGEIDFDSALAWPIGDVDEGFHVAVEELLNTSRWLNAVGSAGIMRRACLEATSFARHREAFDRPIAAFPIVREQIAAMKVEEHAALSSTMALTRLVDRMDTQAATEAEIAAHRLLVNANKFVTSVAATDVVHQGIEVLGGNGTIEDFSVLPRLYRDSVVYESWEGTHNVLCAQVQRDCGRPGLLDGFLAWIRGTIAAAGESEDAVATSSALDALEPRLRRSAAASEAGAASFRRELVRLTRVVQAAGLLTESVRGDAEKAAVATTFIARHLSDDERRTAPVPAALVDDVLAGDLG